MGNAAIVGWCLFGSACGRIGFDPPGPIDSGIGDGAVPGDALLLVSCMALPPTCGPTGTSSCCDSPMVPSGTFYRSYDVGTDGAYPDMTNPATISELRVDRYEVTVGRFRQFVTAGMGTQQSPPVAGAGAHPNISNSGWDTSWNASLPADATTLVADLNCNGVFETWTDAPGANENMAINCVSWFDAMAFCAWDGGFLPTEAEWNYTAAGGSEQRAYPWSSPASSLVIDCSYANYAPIAGECFDPPEGAVNPVGSESPTGDARWGQADLAGNISEWILDWDAGSYPDPCSDCAELTVAAHRVVRGGIFGSRESDLRTGFRANGDPTSLDIGIGMRCARTP